ncbi:hypothetical protein EYF80_015625 [Liparis tanakae]|uniref:Uncharacterized protein n=1 Tax=Liparis tanakae TaxID=230148 RepID=A0A4Z2I8I0_9TELE|nr:hypothetical protein EYF80_015625 [Liparis tanakae]
MELTAGTAAGREEHAHLRQQEHSGTGQERTFLLLNHSRLNPPLTAPRLCLSLPSLDFSSERGFLSIWSLMGMLRLELALSETIRIQIQLLVMARRHLQEALCMSVLQLGDLGLRTVHMSLQEGNKGWQRTVRPDCSRSLAAAAASPSSLLSLSISTLRQHDGFHGFKTTLSACDKGDVENLLQRALQIGDLVLEFLLLLLQLLGAPLDLHFSILLLLQALGHVSLKCSPKLRPESSPEKLLEN